MVTTKGHEWPHKLYQEWNRVSKPISIQDIVILLVELWGPANSASQHDGATLQSVLAVFVIATPVSSGAITCYSLQPRNRVFQESRSQNTFPTMT